MRKLPRNVREVPHNIMLNLATVKENSENRWLVLQPAVIECASLGLASAFVASSMSSGDGASVSGIECRIRSTQRSQIPWVTHVSDWTKSR